jgi:hypothetical protein
MAQWLARLCVIGVATATVWSLPLRGQQNGTGDASALQQITDQNRQLQTQLKEQQKVIENLTVQMAEMRQASARQERDLHDLQVQIETPTTSQTSAASSSDVTVRLSGELGLAYFRTGAAGQFPNSVFRVDEAKVFLEAVVWKNVYLFSELDLVTRETPDEAFHLGELYIDFENVIPNSAAIGRLNLRVGRFNSPFGEEYQSRNVLANPLISHSLSDIWGFDQGIEIYGSAGKVSFVAAVQNGGGALLNDFTSDKALVARIGFTPAHWLHVSASGMRTGDLSAKDDFLSAIWFGNGFFRALGPAETTRKFHAELFEFDAKTSWSSGYIAAAVGRANFNDDDSSASNARAMNYNFIEGLQKIGEKFYGVARYSEIRAPNGYPLVGWGTFGAYFFSPLLTEKLDRLSLGFGYRIAPPLVLKFEYTMEGGRLTTGVRRDKEDFIGTEVGLKF